MDLCCFTLGKQLEGERRIYAENSLDEVVGEVTFFELGLAFRAMQGWGPSTLEILIPYGSPVYRQSERPLSALATYGIYHWPFGVHDDSPIKKMMKQTGLWLLFEQLFHQPFGFCKAGLMLGQSMREKSATGRDSIIVNDCIQHDYRALQYRVALIDLLFELNASDDEDGRFKEKIEEFVGKYAQQNEFLRFLSAEYRRIEAGGFHDEPRQRVHVYLMIELDEGLYEERMGWATCCHNLYYRSFMSTADDANDERIRLACAMYGGMDVIGEYSWNKQLADIVPPKNEVYDKSCRSFRDAKEMICKLQSLGEHPEFVSVMKDYKMPKPSYKVTRADILEAMVMGRL